VFNKESAIWTKGCEARVDAVILRKQFHKSMMPILLGSSTKVIRTENVTSTTAITFSGIMYYYTKIPEAAYP
jgi:hypothetical protein